MSCPAATGVWGEVASLAADLQAFMDTAGTLEHGDSAIEQCLIEVNAAVILQAECLCEGHGTEAEQHLLPETMCGIPP